MWVNVSTSYDGALPLSNLLEIHLQKGFILCISLRVFFKSSMICGSAFTLSVIDASLGDVLLVGLCVLLWVRVAGPYGVDVTNILIEAGGCWECP